MRAPRTKSSKKCVAALALAAAAAAPAQVEAAPYLHVSLVGRVQGSGQPFASSVDVLPGDIVEYEVRFQLGVEGAVNPHAGFTPTASSTTITNWIPSNGATSPTAGLNNMRFNVGQSATPGQIQSDFDAGVTYAGGWGAGLGSTPGTPTPRGNGYDDLQNVIVNRGFGDFLGIGPDEQPQLLTVVSGEFDIASGGSPVVLSPNINGLVDTNIIASIRWRNAANTSNVNYAVRVDHQNFSTNPAAPNPIIIYNGLTLVPEPTILCLAAGVFFVARRRRML